MPIPVVDFFPMGNEESPIKIVDLKDLAASNLFAHDGDIEQSHRMNFSMMLMIESGSGSHFVDFGNYEFHAGSLIFVNKNQVHSFDFTNQPSGKAILFTDEFIQKIQSNMRISIFYSNYFKKNYSPILNCDEQLKVTINHMFIEIEKELNQEKPSSMVLMLLFSAVVLKIDQKRNVIECTGLQALEYQKMNQFLQYVEEDFTKTRNAADYAEKLSISYKSLNNLCKKASGQTAKHIIDSFTILEAKRRLAVSGLQVKELAFELGFDEVTNFTKYFKKHTLLSPSHFRKV